MAVNLHPLIAGTAGLWQFQNSLADTSGNGNTLAVVSGSATYSTLAGSVVGFDFNAARLLEGPIAAALQLGGEFTIQFLNIQRGVNTQTFTQCQVPGGATIYAWYSTTFAKHAYADQHVNANLSPDIVLANFTPNVNQWTLRRRSTGGSNYIIEFFQNGVLQGSTLATTTNTTSGNERLFVGGFSGGANLNAVMASLRILNYSRADSDLIADYVYVLGNSTSITLGTTASTSGAGALAGTAAVSFGASAAISAKMPIAGTTAIAIGSNATLGAVIPIAGSTSIQFLTHGTITSSSVVTSSDGAELTLTEFGPFTSPISNSGAREVDAEWYVDFTRFGESVALTISVIAQSDIFYSQAATIGLWSSDVEGDASSAVLLGTLAMPLAGTTGTFDGFTTTVVVANPGAPKYLVLTSENGF